MTLGLVAVAGFGLCGVGAIYCFAFLGFLLVDLGVLVLRYFGLVLVAGCCF